MSDGLSIRREMAQVIRETRIRNGVSQKDLAKRAGISNVALCNAESDNEGGKALSFDTLVKCCRALDVSIRDVVEMATRDERAQA